MCRRDRLAGSLEGEELVSRRTQAAIAAGLLAFSTGAAPAAFGSPRDEVIEGTEEVVPGGDVDFELGGETGQLPDVSSPPPGAQAPVADDEDSEPVEQEPVTDVSGPIADGDADRVADDAATEPEPIASEPSPSASAPGPALVADPAEAQTRAADRGPKHEAVDKRRTLRPRASEAAAPAQGSGARTTRSDVTVAPVAVPVAPARTTTEPAPVTVRVVAHTSTGRAAKGQRFHTVQQGESLWSIAADVLGEDATVARIAREVQRLWELNDERIGTGQPDLLFAGTRLRLR